MTVDDTSHSDSESGGAYSARHTRAHCSKGLGDPCPVNDG